jgi:protein TonB
MLSQETFLPWLILSLGIHIATLTWWPLPASWLRPTPAYIVVDLIPGSGSGGSSRPGLPQASGPTKDESLLPPAALKAPSLAPAPATVPPPSLPPRPQIPARQAAPRPLPAPPAAVPKPGEPLSTRQETALDMPPTIPAPLSAGHAQGLPTGVPGGTGTAPRRGTAGTGPGTGGAGGTAAGHGLPGSGAAGGSGGAIRATPLGYGDNPPMPYPRVARRRGWQGEVLLRVQVTPSGHVVDVQLEKSSGYHLLDDTARQEVRHWRFRPARRNGTAVADTVLVPVQFQLQER